SHMYPLSVLVSYLLYNSVLHFFISFTLIFITILFYFFMSQPPQISTLFPYTTLFRSHLQSEQPWRLPEPDRRPVRGPGVRRRLYHPIRARRPAAGAGIRTHPPRDHGQRHHAARRPRPAARARRARRARAGLPLRSAGARVRPHGAGAVPRWLAVRGGAVVPAGCGVRRRARLEHLTKPRPG